MANCEEACQDMVRNYAKTGYQIIIFMLIWLLFVAILGIGCGKIMRGSKTVYKYDAGGCGKGVGKEIYTCA